MKRFTITIALVLGLGMTTFATPIEGGLFKRGSTVEEYYGMGNSSYFNSGQGLRAGHPMIPDHEQSNHSDADAPLGTGIILLMGLGAAYLLDKRCKKE